MSTAEQAPNRSVGEQQRPQVHGPGVDPTPAPSDSAGSAFRCFAPRAVWETGPTAASTVSLLFPAVPRSCSRVGRAVRYWESPSSEGRSAGAVNAREAERGQEDRTPPPPVPTAKWSIWSRLLHPDDLQSLVSKGATYRVWGQATSE